jgi:4-hydroxy-2-oxoheptanedioate aldolase
MVPLANSAEIVRNIVKATKYPPHGIRGFGPMFTHATGKLEGEYKATANEDLVIAVQIEHPNAVKEIDEIVNTSIDVAFIGPFDLSVSMGVPFGSEEHEAAIAKVLEACKKAGKVAAIFCESFCSILRVGHKHSRILSGVNGEQAKRRFEQGFQMVSITTDIGIITTGFASESATALATGSSASQSKGTGYSS